MANTQLRIRDILAEKNISLKEFASMLGISNISLSQNFKKNNFTLETLEKYASLLDVEVSDFFIKPSAPQVPTTKCPHCGKELHIETVVS